MTQFSNKSSRTKQHDDAGKDVSPFVGHVIPCKNAVPNGDEREEKRPTHNASDAENTNPCTGQGIDAKPFAEVNYAKKAMTATATTRRT
jgi:hypothetical protein